MNIITKIGMTMLAIHVIGVLFSYIVVKIQEDYEDNRKISISIWGLISGILKVSLYALLMIPKYVLFLLGNILYLVYVIFVNFVGGSKSYTVQSNSDYFKGEITFYGFIIDIIIKIATAEFVIKRK